MAAGRLEGRVEGRLQEWDEIEKNNWKRKVIGEFYWLSEKTPVVLGDAGRYTARLDLLE